MSQETQQHISHQIRIWIDKNGQLGMQAEGNLSAPLLLTALLIMQKQLTDRMITPGQPLMINPTKTVPSLKINRMP